MNKFKSIFEVAEKKVYFSHYLRKHSDQEESIVSQFEKLSIHKVFFWHD